MNDEELDIDEEIDDDWGDEDEDTSIIEIEHVVMPGCTDIIAICSQYSITDWKDVCELNNIKRPNNIKVGDIIVIQMQEE